MQMCNKCGESAVEENVNHSQEKVCTACGVVVDDAAFDSERIHFRPALSKYRPLTAREIQHGGRIIKKSKSPAALIYGLDCLSCLCKEFTLTSIWESEMADVLKDVYRTKSFKRKEDVAVLGGCILYWMLKTKYQTPVLLTDIIQHLQCTKKNFSSHLNLYKSWLCKNEKNIPIENDIQCQKSDSISNLNPPKITESIILAVCKNSLKDEKSKLMEMTTEAVKLAYCCWLGTGRHARSIVIACTYFCWKSLDPCKRRKASFPKFCSEFGIQEPGARNRVSEFEELLLQLGRKIPPHCEDYVNKSNLIFHIDTILKNSETLRFDRLEGKFSKEEINCDEFSTFRSLKRMPPREVSKSAINYDSDMNASDVEIPDSEIDEYINYGVQKKAIEDLCVGEKGVLENKDSVH